MSRMHLRTNVLIALLLAFFATEQVQAQFLFNRLYTFGTPDFDRPLGVVLDAEGNAYVAGTMTGTGEGFYLTKYDANGDLIWVNNYEYGYESLYGITYGSDGNLYLTGIISNPANTLTIKCNQQGAIIWDRSYDGPAHQNDSVGCAAVDAEGNVYVCGSSEYNLVGAVPPLPTTQLDWLIIKYNSEGVQQWVRNYNVIPSGSEFAHAIFVDSAGNIVVTGDVVRSGTGRDLATLKYDPQGNLLWEAHYNGPSNPNESYRDSELGADDSIFVAGAAPGAIAMVKYNSAGVEQWSRRYTGAAAVSSKMALDAAGNSYVMGSGGTFQSGVYWATIKYNAAGDLMWAVNHPSGVVSNNSPGNIAVDSSGFVYVTGETQPAGSSARCTTVMYGPDGEELWSASYDGPYNRTDRGNFIATSADGGLIVAGTLQQTPSNTDWLILRYAPGCTGDCRTNDLRNGADIGAFVQCMATPGCPCADMNLDGAFNQTDVQLFLTVLVNGVDCPGN